MNRFALAAMLLTSVGCVTVKQIGKVNMISNRNVEPTVDYGLITTYAGGSQRELRRSRAESVEQAVDDTVKKVPGGEFLVNARLFIINDKYFAAEGDVWGRKGNLSFRGFSVGDVVNIKTPFGIKTGVVTALRDDKTCFVKTDDGEVITEFKYDVLVKGQDATPTVSPTP